MAAISRRDFLRKTVLASAALGLFGSGLQSCTRHTESIPALVIGSGYGGAVAALRLAQAGVQTVVLERGRRWPITAAQDTFATFEQPDGRAAWFSPFTVAPGLPPVPIDVFPGVLERIAAEGISVLNGAGVGGGSLVNNAIYLQPRRDVFTQVFSGALDYDEMDAVYYPRVREVIQPEPIPADILNTALYETTRVNLAQYEAAGFPTRPTALGIDWDIVRAEIDGTKRPAAIDGQSWYGLNSGAKKSVDQNYLALAEATGFVEILPLHVVSDILVFPEQEAYVVTANQIDEQGGIVGVRHFVCRALFIAAGSTGTSALLTRAKGKGTLPGLPDGVGQQWASNGDFFLGRTSLPTTHVGQGGTAGHVLMEDLDNPFGPVGVVEVVVPKPGAMFFPGLASYIGMGLVPALGTFRYDGVTDTAILHWPTDHPGVVNFVQSAAHTVQVLNDSNPGSATLLLDPETTAHPLGGATLGNVCDGFGRVKGYPRLYVIDGALIPGSTGLVNPALTIAALAERSIEHIIANDLFGYYG